MFKQQLVLKQQLVQQKDMQQEVRPQTGPSKELKGMQVLQKHSQNTRIHILQQHNSQWNKSWCFAHFSAGPRWD